LSNDTSSVGRQAQPRIAVRRHWQRRYPFVSRNVAQRSFIAIGRTAWDVHQRAVISDVELNGPRDVEADAFDNRDGVADGREFVGIER
jgi:hypothetical protein